MKTNHKIYYKSAIDMSQLSSESVDLIVTSPPYPMISMWDEIFSAMNKKIKKALDKNEGDFAYRLMHNELDKVWIECEKVLKPGGIVCINIGDATRTINKEFKLYPNHSDIIQSFLRLGFHILPTIIWHKPTNSPTKFMGSGMLPCGAYVTLEHERILIFRKPQKRVFTSDEEKRNRRESSYFWEERNKWFSDFWNLAGTRQNINNKLLRKRSGAYPLEIPLRLIRMYSSKNDVVLDPFLGTATTTLASIICKRNSIGFEIEPSFENFHIEEIPSKDFRNSANSNIYNRIKEHIKNIDELVENGKTPKYNNSEYGFKVFTKQEIDITFEELKKITWDEKDRFFTAEHEKIDKKKVLTSIGKAQRINGSYSNRSIYN